MSVDFVNGELGTTAHTNVVSSDGYDVTNLLQKPMIGNTTFCDVEMAFTGLGEDAVKGQCNGFMSAYFVKPPIDIAIQFPCLVDITRIVVHRRSGTKRIAEFVLSSANSKPLFISVLGKCNELSINDTAVRKSARHLSEKSSKTRDPPTKASLNNSDASVLRDFPCKYEPDFSLTEIRNQNRSALHTIGRFSSRTSDADVIIFTHPRARINDNDSFVNARQNSTTISLFSLQYLYGVSHLVVRILRTEESTVAAIKRLEVWGKPSNQNKSILNDVIYSLIKKYQSKCMQELMKSNQNATSVKSHPHNVQNSEESSIKSQRNNQTNDGNISRIPEDFTDPITYDIMILPVLLPSGHTIDSATLEKCIKEDERNGRLPLDPFTGIPLGESKAVPNTALKLRIDNFLLQNKVHINQDSQFKHTSGVSSPNANVVEQVVKNVKKRMMDSTNERDLRKAKISNLLSSAPLISQNKAAINNFGQKRLAVNPERCAPIICEKSMRDRSASTTIKEISNADTRHLENSTDACHEARLQSSLEVALKEVAGSVLKPKIKKSDLLEFTCSTCRRHGKETNLFQLPCHHLSCRTCIRETPSKRKCTICSTYFSNGEVVRVHYSGYFNT